jgi:hypothetical protein
MTDPNHNSENSRNPSQECPDSPEDSTSSSEEERGLFTDNGTPDDPPEVKLEIDEDSLTEYFATSLFVDDSREEVSLSRPELAEQKLADSELSEPEPLLFFNGSETFAIRRIQRNEPSFLKKVLPPILGGLAAFPIATAIMWYGLGKDIGSTGPFVAKYAPWIVPTKLQGGSFRSDGTFGGNVAKKKPNDTVPSQSASLPKPTPADTSKSEKDVPTVHGNAESEVPITANVGLLNTSAVPKTERREPSKKRDEGGPSIGKTLRQIAALQKDWNNTPKDREKQLKKLAEFYSACLQLSSQTAAIQGNAVRAWQEDLDQFAAAILASTTFPRAIELCSQGSIEGIPSRVLGDYVVLIETFSISKDLAGDQVFPSKLTVDNQLLPLVVPEALVKRLQNSLEPRKRILLGKITEAESNSIIQVHCCLE